MTILSDGEVRLSQFRSEPTEPTVHWVHPCNCTLVAHESCLLSWIQSAQQDSKRSLNALKCPQCGAAYELESDNPLALRILNSFNGALQLSGKGVTVAGTACLLLSLGFGALSTLLLLFSPLFSPVSSYQASTLYARHMGRTHCRNSLGKSCECCSHIEF